MIWLAAGCAVPDLVDAGRCDARTLDAGEVRARRLPCGDEIPDDSNARSGDWVLENALARFFVRDVYAPLTELEGDGGTLLDARPPDGYNHLLELLPDGDRSSITAENGPGWAELRLPGSTYHLDADTDVLQLVDDAHLRVEPGTSRAGATIRSSASFIGIDGDVVDAGGIVYVTGMTQVALSRESRWPDGHAVDEPVDADSVRVDVDGETVDVLPVEDGRVTGWVADGAVLTGERDGCVYRGLTPVRCGSVTVRVADENGDDLRAVLTDGTWTYTLPVGGQTIPVTPAARRLWVWAGPAYGAWQFDYSGGDDTVSAHLRRVTPRDDVGLGDLALLVGPDATTDRADYDVVHDEVGLGVRYFATLADDEVPDDSRYTHDTVEIVAASRAHGRVWSWAWSSNNKKAAHGAVPWQGLRALDELSMSRGGDSSSRFTVVNGDWVEAARSEAEPWAWDPRPDAFWLDSLADVDTYTALLTDWVDVTPVSRRTWIAYTGQESGVAYEAGLRAGRTSAGNGPRIDVQREAGTPPAVDVRVYAPAWMGIASVDVRTSTSTHTLALVDGHARVQTAPDDAWVVATVSGAQSLPWGGDPAWAVSAPVWVAAP